MQRKGALIVPFLVLLSLLLVCPDYVGAADKRAKQPPEPRPATAPSIQVNDVNIGSQFDSGESLAKKGKPDDALRIFQAVYDYTRDTLMLLKCVKGAYDKALSAAGVDQAQKEELYLKLERIASLTARYSELKAESAYRVGMIYRTKGNAEQARKYLLETCQTARVSLEPDSTWMKAKNALLALSNLEGEF